MLGCMAIVLLAVALKCKPLVQLVQMSQGDTNLPALQRLRSNTAVYSTSTRPRVFSGSRLLCSRDIVAGSSFRHLGTNQVTLVLAIRLCTGVQRKHYGKDYNLHTFSIKKTKNQNKKIKTEC